MGLHRKNSSCGCCTQRVIPDDNNPNPQRFEILQIRVVGGFTVVKVKYPDAKNFEGIKVMVFEGDIENRLKIVNFLDPHFCDDPSHISPIARFEPTERGWKMALHFCRSMFCLG